jgi:hypothetical protein
MATETKFTAGSVESAVTVGSHETGSPKRLRSSSGDSLWTSANSTILMEAAATSRVPARWVRHRVYASSFMGFDPLAQHPMR